MSVRKCRRGNGWHRGLMHWCAILVPLCAAQRAPAQTVVLVEDFEFASTNGAAAAGVIDLTSFANTPALYISGDDENASSNEPGGLFSIGTDAIFCLNPDAACLPGTFIGFRRLVNPEVFPTPCPGEGHYLPLQYTYGDPNHPGPDPPDYSLADLTTVWDVYGDGGFADGDTGTHLWLRLVDCEGEVFEYINFSEQSLYSELWTFDVVQGQNIIRISPESLTDVPDGDRLLTEIAAIDALIQDEDDPPTTVGKWYVDYLRIIEPASASVPGDGDFDGDVDVDDFALLHDCLVGPGGPLLDQCDVFDGDADGDVDLADVGWFQTLFDGGQ